MRKFAEDLSRDGIQVVLDQWHLALGAELPKFMESSITTCDYALLICTELYVAKANDRAGGVGYETSIFASQLLTSAQIAAKEKSSLIPIVRQASKSHLLPTFVQGRFYADLSADTDPANREREYEKLVRTLHDTPQHRAPPLGRNPFVALQREASAPRQPARVSNHAEAELRRTLRTLRTTCASNLVARQSVFSYLLGAATKAKRMSEFLRVLGTHEDYLRECVTAALQSPVNIGVFVEEIEHVIQPKGWSGSGSSRVVELPYAVGWALHRLVGAALVSQSRAADAGMLALERVVDTQGTRQPIILRRNLTGWPLLSVDSHESWEFARTLPHEWSWLAQMFGDAEEFWDAFVAHTLMLNFTEFLWRVRYGPAFEVIRPNREHGLYVPPYYIDEDPDVQRRAVRLMTRDREGLHATLGTLSEDPDLRQQWSQWITFQQSWRSLESHGSAGGAAPHRDLIDHLLTDRGA